MKKTIFLAIPMSVLVNACAIQPPACTTPSVPNVCTSSNQVITINVAGGHLVVAPPNVCAKKGTDVSIRITPPNTTVAVATIPKIPADTWLNGINIPNASEFTISIPNTVPDNTNHDYHIVATNGNCYDPRIHVTP